MKHFIISFVFFLSFIVLPGCGFINRQQPETERGGQVAMPEMKESSGEGSSEPERRKETAIPTAEHPGEAKVQLIPTVSPKLNSPPAKKKSTTDHQEYKKSIPVQQQRKAQKSLSLAELRHKYGVSFKVAGSASEKRVALTFDDGPDDIYTRQVLDVLKSYKVKATFFVIGLHAKAHPDLIARMVREGHIIGNHSYSHANFPKLTESNFKKQIEDTQSILRAILGYEPKLLRPPYGAINESEIRWAMNQGFVIINWNVDSLDWRGLSADKVSQNILSSNRPGSIILQHCGGGENLSGTVKALPVIIQKLKSQGYEMVTVPELLHVAKNK